MAEAIFVMDDIDKQAVQLVECPSCHHQVPLKSITSIGGREVCWSCAGAWYDDDDEDADDA